MPGDGPLLLVVEDDFLVRLTLVDGLGDGGFTVLEAADAKEALDHVCNHDDIAAVLTDINLPGEADGYALARAIRTIRPNLPVVYASGRYAGDGEGRSVTGARFLAKPFTPSVAAAVLRSMIAGTPETLPPQAKPTIPYHA